MIQVSKERIQQFADEYGLSFNEASDQYHAVAKYLAANPITPNRVQMQDVEAAAHHESLHTTKWLSDILMEWQRRMFFAPEPEMLEEIADLMWDSPLYTEDQEFYKAIPQINANTVEAYRRGKVSR